MVLEYLRAHRDRTRTQLWVRINPLSTPKATADLAAIVAGAPDGIMLPKVTSANDVVMLDHYLSALEARDAVEPGSIAIIPVATETAAAMFALGGFAGCSLRLSGMTWGAEDLAAAVGASTNRGADGNLDFTYQLARSLCLLAAVAATSSRRHRVGKLQGRRRAQARIGNGAPRRLHREDRHPPRPGGRNQRRVHAFARRCRLRQSSNRSIRFGRGHRRPRRQDARHAPSETGAPNTRARVIAALRFQCVNALGGISGNIPVSAKLQFGDNRNRVAQPHAATRADLLTLNRRTPKLRRLLKMRSVPRPCFSTTPSTPR